MEKKNVWTQLSKDRWTRGETERALCEAGVQEWRLSSQAGLATVSKHWAPEKGRDTRSDPWGLANSLLETRALNTAKQDILVILSPSIAALHFGCFGSYHLIGNTLGLACLLFLFLSAIIDTKLSKGRGMKIFVHFLPSALRALHGTQWIVVERLQR